MSELEKKLKKLGFVYRPHLPGNPDFAHLGTKLAVYLFSHGDNNYVDKFRQRSSELRSKRWMCIVVFEEDDLREKLSRIKGFMTEQELSRIHLPNGSKPIYEKLVELLKQTDEELEAEEKRMHRRFHVIEGLRKRRKNIERRLHQIFKPEILERDHYRCRACGSKENLELARLYTDDIFRPEKLGKRIVPHYLPANVRWSKENMFILCKECHKLFDSFNARLWRRYVEKLCVDDAVKFLQSGKLKENPPIFKLS